LQQNNIFKKDYKYTIKKTFAIIIESLLQQKFNNNNIYS